MTFLPQFHPKIALHALTLIFHFSRAGHSGMECFPSKRASKGKVLSITQSSSVFRRFKMATFRRTPVKEKTGKPDIKRYV